MIARVLLMLLWLGCCHGEDVSEPISHLILLDKLPATVAANSTPHIEIRTNFSGEIVFEESDTFKVLLNITAPSIQEAYAVAADLSENKGNLLVQVHKKPTDTTTYSLRWIFLTIGCMGAVVLALAICYVVWWHTQGNPQKLYGEQAYMQARNFNRTQEMGGEHLMDQDLNDDYLDAPEDIYRRKSERQYVSMKPETIIEESEESADDDRTNPKLRYGDPMVRQNKRYISISERPHQFSNENLHANGFVDYQDHSGEDENDLSPDQLIAGANGNYTPLDEIDDLAHDSSLQNSQSTIKLADPRGNLDYNIQTSKSDGDLLGDHKKVSEKEKVIIPLKPKLAPKPPKIPSKGVSIPKRAEPNIYQRGLNLKLPHENDLSSATASARADRVRALVHSPEQQYTNGNSNNSFGQYIELKTPEALSRSRISRESNDAYDLYTYPADIPMSTFKNANSSPMRENPYQVPRKPRPVFNQSSSPTAFDFNKLDPSVRFSESNEPYSPGKFSMLSESSDSTTELEDNNLDDDGHGIMRLEDSDIDDLPSPISPNRGDGDLVSNASLPLPSPPPISNHLPFDTHGRISQLSPRQSLVTPLDGKDFGTMIALTGSPSPGGPFSKHSVNEKHFIFPPPPAMFQPQQQPSWSRRELNFQGDESAGEYVGLPMNVQAPPPGRERRAVTPSKRDRRQSESDRERAQASDSERERHQSGHRTERTRSVGRKGGKLPKHLHLTILATCCVLGLISGVYCASSTRETTVNIVVYVPKSYPYKNSTVISAIDSEVKVQQDLSQINWFAAKNPILSIFNSTKCSGKKCEHACDDNTGGCICKHGYEMKNGKCADINECHTGMMQCPNPRSGCLNTEGSYECLCSEKSNLYRYKGMCLDCSDPCPDGRFEIQPCQKSRSLAKICKDCTKSCGENFYLRQACSEKKNAVCLMCQPPCNGSNEFEFAQCHALQNRLCKDKAFLPKPSMSGNVILDDLVADVSHKNTMVQKFMYTPSDRTSLLLKKGVGSFGSEIWVDVTITAAQPVARFKAVDHSDAFTARDFRDKQDILQTFCPYPVPYQYELKFIKHNDVFYKGDTSEGLNSLEPCESHPKSFPNVSSARKNSIFCSKPGMLSDVFSEINPDDYKTRNTVWEEISERCRALHQDCENCSKNCSQNLARTSGDTCTVTPDDDTGTSPRLPTCYTCCMEDNCWDVCSQYHNNKCPMVRCQEGNLVQFQLKPVYENSDTVYCHVEPERGHHVMTIEYGVHIDRMQTEAFLSRKLDIYTDDGWAKTGRIEESDDIIYAQLDSMINTQPDLIKLTKGGNSGTIVDVGRYQVEGTLLKDSTISENAAFIRPSKPFGISKKLFVKQSCEDTSLEDIVLVTHQHRPHVVMHDLRAINHGNGSFLIMNKTVSKGQVGIKPGKSLLRAILPPTKVKFDTLAGNMILNGTHWIILVSGEVETCPGVFSLNLSDPGNLATPLYSFDVGVHCPKKFGINYTVPTGDSPTLSKTVHLQARDQTGTFILVIHTVGLDGDYNTAGNYYDKNDRASVRTQESRGHEYEEKPVEKQPPHFSILFISVVAGAVVLLLLLLVFGVAWKQGIPEGEPARYRIRHLVLLVIYTTFQFVYSILVTMTVFVMIVRAVNVDTTTFMKQYNQQRSVTSALSQLELDSMESHLWREVDRQNTEAKNTKRECYATIQNVISDVEKLRKSIETKSIQTMQKQNLKKLITEHSQSTLTKFSEDLLDFRKKYDKYEHYILHKLTSELNSTYMSIRQSKWLQGPYFVYRYVGLRRELYQKSGMMDFMLWLNMQTDMMQLAKNLTLPLPDLPVIKGDDGSFSQKQTTAQSITRLSPLAVQTTNKWFVQADVVQPTNTGNMEQSSEGQDKKVTSLDPGSYTIFLVAMVILDILWIAHRMVKACGTAKLLLLGYPVYVDARDKEDEKKSNKKSLTKTFRSIARRSVQTMFIPKFIGTLFVCLMVYFVSLCALKFINRETFSLLGYHNDMEDIMKINEDIINTRITSHADRINKLEYKMYEDAMNVNIQNHQYALHLIETQWSAIEKSHTKMYCNYLGRINVTASCHNDTRESTLSEVRVDRCTFAPIIPVLYKRNATSSGKIAGAQLDGFLFNIRKLVSDSCYVIIIYLSAIVIKELLGSVLWIYVKRSGFVSLRIIYETDEAPGSSDNSTINKSST